MVDKPRMKIWICYTEDHTHEIAFSAHRTEEGAIQRLHDYIIGECETHGVEMPDLQDGILVDEWLSERKYTCWVAPCLLKED